MFVTIKITTGVTFYKMPKVIIYVITDTNNGCNL